MRTETQIRIALLALRERFHENELKLQGRRKQRMSEPCLYEETKLRLGYKINMLEFVLGEREFEYGPSEEIEP